MPTNQRGFAHLFLVILLVVGLGVAVWAVQFASTTLKPRANETSKNLPEGFLQMVNPLGEPFYGGPAMTATNGIHIKIGLPQGWILPNKTQGFEFVKNAYAQTDNSLASTCQYTITLPNNDPLNGPLRTGEKYRAVITMTNMGDTVWENNSTQVYRLYSQDPPLNNVWGVGHIDFPYASGVSNGQSAAFTFIITAPDLPGEYSFNWQMHRSIATGGDSFFGSKCSPTFTVETGNDDVVPTPANTPNPADHGNHILKLLTIENLDSDGSTGGHPIFTADKDFEEKYIERAIWWELNQLNSDQSQAPRKVLVTLTDELGFTKTLQTTITLIRPITLHGR